MIVLLLIMIVLVGALPVLAIPPDRITQQTSGSFVLAECDGFDVIDDYQGMERLTFFYDQNGVLLYISYQANMHDWIYNSETGFGVRSTFAYNQKFYPDTNASFIRGAAYEITVPGYGPVYFDAGLGFFVDGNEVKFEGIYLADPDLLCEAMDQ